MNDQRCASTARAQYQMIPRRYQQRLTMAACVVFAVLGCRKDEDRTAPVVTILAPGNGSTLVLPDTLVVRAEVSDDNVVESVSISLSDPDGIPITASINVAVGETHAIIERAMVINSDAITSGSYTLTVRANDGSNDRRAFRSIQLIELPLRRKAVFAVCPGAGATEVYKLDSLGVTGSFLSDPGDFSMSALNSAAHRLWIAGGVNGPLRAYDCDQGSVAWQVANPNVLSTPYFTSLDPGPDDRLYVAALDGFLRGYDMISGIGGFNATIGPNWLVLHSTVAGDRVVTEQKQVSSATRRLLTYTHSAGTVLDDYPLDVELSAMFTLDDAHVLLFGQRAGDGVVQQRDITNGNIWEPLVLPGEAILEACPLDNGSYAVRTSNQVGRYAHPAAFMTSIGPAAGVQAMAYDRSTGDLFLAQGAALQTLDPSNGTVLGTNNLPQAPTFLHVQLNR